MVLELAALFQGFIFTPALFAGGKCQVQSFVFKITAGA